MKRLVLIFAFVLLLVRPAMAEVLVWKTEAELGKPVELKTPCEEQGGANCLDYISYQYKSKSGQNVYQDYFEGVRFSLGFGTTRNTNGMFLTEQDHPGGYDWGGTEIDGEFTPYFIIKRFYVYDLDKGVDKSRTQLEIFRIKDNGTSCFVDTSGETTADNAMARKWAERTLKGPGCPK